MKNYTVIQDGIKECGSACLLSIIRYYEGNVSFDKLVEMTNTSKEGTTFYDLANASYELGLNSKGYKISNIEEMRDYNLPFISQVIINNYKHFVVVYKIKKDVITIMDPANGMRKVKLSYFENIMTGYILTFSPYKKLPVFIQDNYVVSTIKKVISSNKKTIIELILWSIIVTILTCIYSYYLQIVIDNYLYADIQIVIITLIFMIILFNKVFLQYFRNNILFYFN